MIACDNKNVDIVKLLLDWNCDLYALACNGHSALEFVRNKDFFQLLLSKVSFDHKFKNGTALDIAINKGWVREYIDELVIRNKHKILQNTYYERVFKFIPEHDAAVRFKIGNMGYKICKYHEDKMITQELLDYLSATAETIDVKVNNYLGF